MGYKWNTTWAITKNKILPFSTTWMDLEDKWNKSMKDICILNDITYMYSLNIKQTSEYNKKEICRYSGSQWEGGKRAGQEMGRGLRGMNYYI